MTIDLNPTPDQRQIIGSMRKVLADTFPLSRLHGEHAASPDTSRLRVLADMGAFGLGTSEQFGGAGFSLAEEVLLFIELGRHLVSPKALAATIGARLAAALGRDGLAAAIVAGSQTVCIATALRPFAFDALDGLPVHLLDAPGASFALLWNDGGHLLLRMDRLAGERVDAVDRAVVLQRCTLAEHAVEGRLSAAQSGLGRQADLLIGAQLLGIGEAVRDMAVGYATLRKQFGQPIGAFQAVKHRCANMAINAQVLRAQLIFATLAERDAWPDATFQGDACRMLAARCALENARSNIQVHGAMGFTAECDAHRYLLRAHLYEPIGGPMRQTAERVLRHPTALLRDASAM